MTPSAIALLCAALFAAAAVPTDAWARVYKCPQPGGQIAYQDSPCAGNAQQQALELDTHTPNLADRFAAEQRAADERRFVREVESEREYNKQLARIERANERKAEQKRAEKCAQYLNRAAYLEERATTWYTESYRKKDFAEARYIRNQHFTECSGSR